MENPTRTRVSYFFERKEARLILSSTQKQEAKIMLKVEGKKNISEAYC